MSISIHEFKHPYFGLFHSVMYNDEPWFPIQEVCECLGIPYNNWIFENLLGDDNRAIITTDDGKDMHATTCWGVYSLVMSSLPVSYAKAHKLTKWISNVVVPGTINTPVASKNTTDCNTEEELLKNPSKLLKFFYKLVSKTFFGNIEENTAVDSVANIPVDIIDTVTKQPAESMASTNVINTDNTDNTDSNSTKTNNGCKYSLVKDIDWLETIFDNKKCIHSIAHAVGTNLSYFCKRNNYKAKRLYIYPTLYYNTYSEEAIAAYKQYLLDNPRVLWNYRRKVTADVAA